MTKVWFNLSGTTAETFSISKSGPTLMQGDAMPDNSEGSDGDLYMRTGASSGFYQRVSGVWQSLVPTSFVRQEISRGSTDTVDNITTYVAVISGSTSATTINLPTGVEGMQIIFKDETGTAQNYNILIKETGTTKYTINTGYGSVTLVYTDSSWFVVRKFT